MTSPPDDRDEPRLRTVHSGDSKPTAVAVPPGKVEMIVTYLDMSAHPSRAARPHPAERVAIMRAEVPTVSFYRYLYNTVGEQWLWYVRRHMSDAALSEIICDPRVEVYVLYVRGVPAGFVELDRRVEGEVELAYCGLMPDFLGRGYGQYIVDWAVETAWSHHPQRVWVNTCNHDHPRAVGAYQKAGFRPYAQETALIDDPRINGQL